jgi:hypothetical protein
MNTEDNIRRMAFRISLCSFVYQLASLYMAIISPSASFMALSAVRKLHVVI